MHIEFNRLSRSRLKQVTKLSTVDPAANGAKYLGEGCFAVVFDIGANRVMKVLGKNLRGELQDRYLSWARFCVANRNKNKHLPRIDLIASTEDKYVFVIEKLHEVEEFRAKRPDGSFVSYYEDDVLDSFSCSVVDFVNSRGAKYTEHFCYEMPPGALEMLPKRSAHKLNELVTASGLYLNDVGPTNMMIRRGYGKKPTLVITDPIA